MDLTFSGWPFPAAVAALFVVVCLRAGGTYLLGRGISRGVRGTRLRRMTETPAYGRAERIVARWGALAVLACFLTIGVQTMVNLVAGVGRMPLRRYLPALALGGLVWALLYATVGSVTWVAFSAVYRSSPALAVALGVALVAGAAGFVIMQVRSRRVSAAETTGEGQPIASATSRTGSGSG